MYSGTHAHATSRNTLGQMPAKLGRIHSARLGHLIFVPLLCHPRGCISTRTLHFKKHRGSRRSKRLFWPDNSAQIGHGGPLSFISMSVKLRHSCVTLNWLPLSQSEFSAIGILDWGPALSKPSTRTTNRWVQFMANISTPKELSQFQLGIQHVIRHCAHQVARRNKSKDLRSQTSVAGGCGRAGERNKQSVCKQK